MAQNLTELFAKMGVDVDQEGMYDIDSGDMCTNSHVENGSNTIRKLKVDFGLNYHLLVPVWLLIPFNIATLEPLGKNKAMMSYKLEKTPATILHTMSKIAEDDEEYKAKLWKVLDIDEFLLDQRKQFTKAEIQNFKFWVEEDGSCHPLMGLLVSKFFNFYMYTGVIQRYTISSERTINRAAMIPLKSSGVPDFDKAPDWLNMAYQCESNLLYQEILKTEAAMKVEAQTKKAMDDRKSAIRRSRIVSPPNEAAFVYSFAYPINSSNEFTEKDKERFEAASHKIQYQQAYFRILSKDIEDFNVKARASKITNVNYIEIVRSFPESDSENKGNKGLCAQGAYQQQVIAGKEMKCKIPNINLMVQDHLSDPKNTNPDEVRKFINEFESISEDEVRSAYANNISQYALALKDPNVVKENRAFLSQCEGHAGLALVNTLVESNQPVIDINAPTVTEEEQSAIINEEEYFDSDEAVDDTVSAAAFVNAD